VNDFEKTYFRTIFSQWSRYLASVCCFCSVWCCFMHLATGCILKALSFFFLRYVKQNRWRSHEENTEVSLSVIYATTEGGETGNYSFYQFCYLPKDFVIFTVRHDLSASVSRSWKYKSNNSDMPVASCHADGLATSIKVRHIGWNSKEGLHHGFRLGRRLKREVSSHLLVKQRCKIPESQVARTAKFCTVPPNIFGPSLQNLLHVTFLRRPLNFCAAFW
jgi:hypothetical protein